LTRSSRIYSSLNENFALPLFVDDVVQLGVSFSCTHSLTYTQGDLLASLFETPTGSMHGGDNLGMVGDTFNLDPLLNFPTSPVYSEGYSTDSSSTGLLNGNRSPAASIPSAGSSAFDQQSTGDSPSNSPFMTMSIDGARGVVGGVAADPAQYHQWETNELDNGEVPFQNALNEMLGSSDVTIDVGEDVGGVSCLELAG